MMEYGGWREAREGLLFPFMELTILWLDSPVMPVHKVHNWTG